MSNLIIILWIGAGGLVGTISRYLISISIESDKLGDFPLPTFMVNVAGCFIVGFVSEITSDSLYMPHEIKLGIVTGFAGAFTTYSTFLNEIYHLSRDSQIILSLLYLVISLVTGAIFLYLGVIAARLVSK